MASMVGTDAQVPRTARILGSVGRGLITAGVVVLLFVVYQLWGTNLQEARAQDDLRSEFDGSFLDAQEQLANLSGSPAPVDAGGDPGAPAPLPPPSIPTADTLPGGIPADVAAFFFPEDGDAVARIEIPSIDVDKIVVSGVQVADLRRGPGHYPGTAAVGTEGNTSIAGHRTTYGAPFNRIDELDPGDEIAVTGLLGRFTYRVLPPDDAFAEELHTTDEVGRGHIIVNPGATWVLGEFGDNRVTLTACHPELSSRQRIIVAAELVDEPVAAPDLDPDLLAELGADLNGARLASEDGSIPNLDEGLDGERDAIPGAVAWMAGAVAVWVGAGMLARRLFDDRPRRLAVRMVGLIPAAACLWYSFEMIDRALPAA